LAALKLVLANLTMH